MTTSDNLAALVIRGETVESVHRAHAAVVRADGRLAASFGDPDFVTFTRSAAKPFQALPLVESGAADAFGLAPGELAVVAGSHLGEEMHVATLRRVLGAAGVDEGALQCGRHAPYHAETAKKLGDAYTAIHHNCSGKHAGMLLLSRHLGAHLGSYLEPSHPVQQRILAAMALASGTPASQIRTGTDGCGAPNFALPLRAIAHAFARLGTASGALGRVREAMVAHPEMVSGTGGFDTDLMRAFPGMVSKVGAEGLSALATPELGIALKVEDGASRPRSLLALAILGQLGIEPAHPERLARHRDGSIRNHAGAGVGRIQPVLALKR